jgi:hypothetical protein
VTKAETNMIMAILKVAYPLWYKDLQKEDAIATVSLWAELFADDPVIEVAAAVKALIATKKTSYPPTIGDVKEKLVALRFQDELTAQEAWALVSKAVASTDWNNPSKQFYKLPESVQAAVGSPDMLREWGMVDVGVFQTVISSNFIRAFEAKQRRAKEMAALPESVKTLLSGASEKLRIEERMGGCDDKPTLP